MIKLKFDGSLRDDDACARLLKSVSWISCVQSGLIQRYRQQVEPCVVTANFETLVVYGCLTMQGETRLAPTPVWGFSSRLKLYQADFVLGVHRGKFEDMGELIETITDAAIVVVAQVAVLIKKTMVGQARAFARSAQHHFPEMPPLLQ